MEVDVNGYFTLKGKAAWIFIGVTGVILVAMVIKPEILGWILGSLFYSGPR